jgi:hypothetical protein
MAGQGTRDYFRRLTPDKIRVEINHMQACIDSNVGAIRENSGDRTYVGQLEKANTEYRSQIKMAREVLTEKQKS